MIKTKEKPLGPFRSQMIFFLCFLIAFWMYSSIPNTTNLIIAGRGEASGSGGLGTIVETNAAGIIRQAMFIVVVLLGIKIFTSRVWFTRWTFPPLVLVVTVGTGLILVFLVHFDAQGVIGIVPAYIVAIVSFMVPRTMYTGSLVGTLTGVTALMSIGWAFFQPEVALMNQWSYGENKKVFSSGLLAGPFTHSNILGMTLVSGLPWIGHVHNKLWRSIFFISCIVAVIWSASRTSIAMLVVLLLLFTVIQVSRRSEITIFLVRLALPLTALIGLIIPFLPWSRSAFQGRGWIWAASNVVAERDVIFGSGQSAFVTGAVADSVGYTTSHAHNIYMTALVKDGLVGLLILIIVLSALIAQAIRVSRISYAPLFSVMSILFIGIVEMSFSITAATQNGGYTWLIVAAVFSLGSSTSSTCTFPVPSGVTSHSQAFRPRPTNVSKLKPE